MDKKEKIHQLDLTNQQHAFQSSLNRPADAKRLNLLLLLILLTSTLLPYTARAQSMETDAPQEPPVVSDATEPPYASATGAAIPEPANVSNVDATPAWVEPRGLSIVDLVGIVPEDQLRGAIIRYWPGLSLTLYQWGRRNGNQVTIRVKYSMQWPGMAFCLGKPGEYDQWPVVVPESTMRVFEHGVDITNRVSPVFYYFPAGLTQPSAPTYNYRYPEYKGQLQFNASGAALVPANTGCSFILHYTSGDLEAEFTFNSPPVVSVEQLGSQSAVFHSYIGPGSAGLLDSLRGQMQSRFGNRHENFLISPPAGTNYVLVRYPLTPVDPYGPSPNYPGGGTYRVRRPNTKLSVDHINTMGIPYYGQWQDADQSGGADFLPYFTDGIAISAPEYFVPQGISYDPCMTNGGCSSALLNAIHDAETPLTVYFYNVQPTVAGLKVLPLRQVGPGWDPASVTHDAPAVANSAPAEANTNHHIYMPAIATNPATTRIIYTGANCPCGIFTADGRMVGFLPQPF